MLCHLLEPYKTHKIMDNDSGLCWQYFSKDPNKPVKRVLYPKINPNDQFQSIDFNLKSYIVTGPIKNIKQSILNTINLNVAQLNKNFTLI
jgi:hypothetical protein